MAGDSSVEEIVPWPRVDVSGFGSYQNSACYQPLKFRGYTDSQLQDKEGRYTSVRRSPVYDMPDAHALLCPRTIRGFSLRDKFWADFRLDLIKDIAWDPSYFDKLQIDPKVKKIVESLVEQHTRSGKNFKDLIEGKGRGLTILLHGPPGSGNTLTAETISERAKKPLYTMTSGELGVEAAQAEQKLLHAFKLAHGWSAILLIDEADVFLAARSSSSDQLVDCARDCSENRPHRTGPDQTRLHSPDWQSPNQSPPSIPHPERQLHSNPTLHHQPIKQSTPNPQSLSRTSTYTNTKLRNQ